MLRSRLLRFRVAAPTSSSSPPPIAEGTRRPPRQFSYATVNNGAAAELGHKREAERRQGLDKPLAPARSIEPSSSPGLYRTMGSSRNVSKEYQSARNAADYFTPNTDSSFRGGMDAQCTAPATPSPEVRRARLREALEANAHSHITFVGEDGAMDFDRNSDAGPSPKSQIRDDGVDINTESSMYQTLFKKGALDSRRASTTWSLLDRRQSSLSEAELREVQNELRINNTVHDRQWREHEGAYHSDFDDPVLEHAYESVDHTTSIYTHRKMFLDGLFGVERFLSRNEEKLICEEVMKLTQQPTAAYIAEEARYCVNLYERTLGVPGMDPLAFSLNQHAPTLLSVLQRAFDVGLIPSIPNVCQCSEFVGNFSGYPLHQKHSSLGPFVGVMSLVSDSVMHLSHISQPWSPKVYVRPRSVYVMQHPCLGEYKVGFRQPHKPFHNFRFATRQSKDYRIEILFACVDTKQLPALRDAVNITDYAAKRLIPDTKAAAEAEASTASKVSATMAEQLRRAMESMGKKGSTVDPLSGTRLYESSISKGKSTVRAVDGAELHKQSLHVGLVGAEKPTGGADATKRLVEAKRSQLRAAERTGMGIPTRSPPTRSASVIAGKYTSDLPDWDN